MPPAPAWPWKPPRQEPDGTLRVTTSNRDGRGAPAADDRVFRFLPIGS